MGFVYTGWVVSIRDGVLINGMGCYSPGWVVTKRDGAFVNGMLVNVLEC